MTSPDTENVLNYAVAAFAETIALKVKQLRRFVPKEAAKTNTDLTGAFIEELVRGFIRGWIGHHEMLHGTFYHQLHCDSGNKPMQIDGIVYDPTRGPATLREGDFIVVHPAFCSGVVEVKMTFSSMAELEKRLWHIHMRNYGHFQANQVMGVVIADRDPSKASQLAKRDGSYIQYFDYGHAPLPRRDLDVGVVDEYLVRNESRDIVQYICPIFILFKETDDGEYEPFYPAIESMIRAIYIGFLGTQRSGMHNLRHQ
jgi:hypothetical protein